MSALTETTEAKETRIRASLKADFVHYAAKCLTIRPKAGDLCRLNLNKVQLRVHKQAEALLKEKGRIRIIVLKARQPGMSTYIEGRLFWRVTHERGRRAFILTHSDDATGNIFTMARRFYDNCPELVKPALKAANARELDFGKLDSGYRVGTAKASAVGRSDTIQYFHGSEVAHWPNPEEHAAGVLQAIPNEDGTEIWLESTANGAAGLFFNMAMAAERGENEYTLVFVPWFEHGEYETESPVGWKPPPAFSEYQSAFGLTNAQLFWGWTKNRELAAAEGDSIDEFCWRFRQEYPATAAEAFRASRAGSYIPPEAVLRARKLEFTEKERAQAVKNQALVIGCDFARGDSDHNWFISRRGRIAGIEVNERFHSDDTEDIAGRLARVIQSSHPSQCFLDTGGGGAGVYDILCNRGFGHLLTLVNFGGKAADGRLYANKRGEMYGEMKAWLTDVGGASIPDSDTLDGELTATQYKYNANQQVVLETKDRLRARLKMSPDGADALALTFTEPVILGEDAFDNDDLDDFDRNPTDGY